MTQQPTDDYTNALIDAAEEHASAYDDDDRECIKTDVMNAFYAGTAWHAEHGLDEDRRQLQARLEAAQRELAVFHAEQPRVWEISREHGEFLTTIREQQAALATARARIAELEQKT
jgi:hypothetical protein